MSENPDDPVWGPKRAGEFTASACYQRDRHQFYVIVQHADGRGMGKEIPANFEPRWGLDVSDAAAISDTAEELARLMEQTRPRR